MPEKDHHIIPKNMFRFQICSYSYINVSKKNETNINISEAKPDPPLPLPATKWWVKDFILLHKYHAPNFYQILSYFSKLKMKKLTIISRAII